MISLYSFEKAVEMLRLGYVFRVVRVAKNRTVAFVRTSDGKQTLGRVPRVVRNRILDEVPLRLDSPGRWVYDYAAKETP
jgi:hypothetical protein